MNTHQVEHNGQTWRGDQNDTDRDISGPKRAKKLTEERMKNRELADRKRAEYLQHHDDDEAELDVPR